MVKEARFVEAVHLATKKLATSTDFDNVLMDVLSICTEAVGASGGSVYLHDPVEHRLRFRHVLPEYVAEKLPFLDLGDDEGVAGAAFQSREIIISEFEVSTGVRQDIQDATGIMVRTMITVPLVMSDEEPIGVVQLINKMEGKFDETDAAVLDTVAAICTMAYLNSKLLEESSRASSLLGMGKLSHDIGNLAASLYAQLQYSEDSVESLCNYAKESNAPPEVQTNGEALAEMFVELRSSVDRIVSYSRLISDLSAGKKIRPKMVLAKMGPTIMHSAAFLQTAGRNAFVKLEYDIDMDAPANLHDPMFLFRIVQNLVGNAIKAVRETIPDDLVLEEDDVFGTVTVRYRFDGSEHILEVIDTGPGMTEQVAKRLLAGKAHSQWGKASGSGWGMRIVLELAETHGAKVFIDTELGKGSAFKVKFPNAETKEGGQPFVH